MIVSVCSEFSVGWEIEDKEGETVGTEGDDEGKDTGEEGEEEK